MGRYVKLFVAARKKKASSMDAGATCGYHEGRQLKK